MNSHMHTAVESSYRASETSRALMAATLGLVLGLAACDRLLGADRRIERAQESFEAGRYDAAMSDVKTALEAEPENAQGRLLLARISLRLGDAAAARQELDRALAAGADPAQARELHYEILLREGRYQDALIAAAVDDDLAPARRLGVMAHSQLALGQYDEAAEAVQELKALDAGDSAILLLEARLHWANGRHAEAEQSLDQLLAQDPADAEAWMQKARVASAAGRIPDARAAYTEALKTANQQLALPEIAAIHVGLVENYLALSDLDGADAAFRPMQARFAEAFVTQYLGARIALARGDFSAAVTGLQRALAGQPDNVPARLLLGAALIGQGSSEQAEAELSQIIARQPDNVEARKLLARVYLARNDTAAARRVLADLPEGDAADPATDWFTGAVMMMAGQATEGIARLEQAAAADDKNTALKLDLARAYIGAGRRADALRTLSRIPEAEGGAAKRQLMLLAEVAGLEPAAARQGVERLMRENSRDADLLTAAGSYLMQIGDVPAAAAAFQKAAAASPRHVDSRMGLAAVAHRGGELRQAEAELQKVLEIEPGNERALVALARVTYQRGDRAGASKLLERAISHDPNVIESRLQLADIALAEGDPAKMRSLVQQALTVAQRRAGALDRAGQILMRASLYDEALSHFNEAAEKGHDAAAVRAASALRALGREDEARAQLEAIASRRVDWPDPVVSLVSLDVGQKRFAAALRRIDAFQRAGGPVAIAGQLRGDVHMAAGEPDKAVAAYQAAAEASPSALLAIRLFRAREAAGIARPESGLRQWVAQHPNDQVVRFLLAEQAYQGGQRKEAIAEYERALKGGSNPAILNNLAWLYYEEGDPRAAEFARRAYEAVPENGAVADTYGWVLVESDRVQEGLPILEKAARLAPDNGEIQYHYAAALARAGKKDEAAARLRELLKSGADFPSKRQAEALAREAGAP